jgi:hypothetical protein
MGVICYFYAHVHQTNLEFGKNIITKYLFWLLESNNTPSMHNTNIMLWINHCQNITPPYYTLCNNIFIFFLTMNVCDLHKERLKWSWVERGPKLLLNIWLSVEWSSTILRVSSYRTIKILDYVFSSTRETILPYILSWSCQFFKFTNWVC